MNIKFVGRKVEVKDSMKERTEKKLTKISNKFFGGEGDVNVVFSVRKDRHITEITIYHQGMIFRAEESADNMFAAIDEVCELLERQIRKQKTKLQKRLHITEMDFSVEDDHEEVAEESEFHIVRSKRIGIKPMSVEEAILQMNLLGHMFFVFIHADTEQPAVVYRRKDGNYGLIETE